jgi:hypothetical protein
MGQAMNLHLPDDRADRLRRVMDATGENTKAGAIDVALSHYLADLENKQHVADELPAQAVDKLSTPWMRIERETNVNTK